MVVTSSIQGVVSSSLVRAVWVSVLSLTPVLHSLAAETGSLAPPILLAQSFKGTVVVADYWVSEKLDGVRAVWDGQTLRFRSGRVVPAPAWFLAGLPAEPLDGELWMGRGRFEALAGAVRRLQPRDEDWRQIEYRVYEQPGGSGSFTDRVARLASIATRGAASWVVPAEQFRLADRAALEARLQQVVALGGEGLMLHKADAPWLTGRQDVLLKFKPHEDAEATVLAHLPGKGRLAGRVGALLVQDATGRRFQVGSGLDDALREHPPAVGARITYRFRARTRDGVPRFPTYLRQEEIF
jgi:DNA ligase-1